MLRGSRDFDTIDDYTGFVSKVVDRRNRLVQEKLEQERPPPATPAASSGAGVRQPPGPGAQVEHHPGSGTDLHRALPAHRQGGADPAVRRAPGSVLQGPPGGTDGAGKGRAGGPGRLPPRHRLPGAQARGLRPLPVPGADVSQHDLSPGLRRAARLAGRACRRGVRAHPALGSDDHGVHGGQCPGPAAGGGETLRLRRGQGAG